MPEHLNSRELGHASQIGYRMHTVTLRAAAAALLSSTCAQALEGQVSPSPAPPGPLPRIDYHGVDLGGDISALRVRPPGATEFGSLADLFSRTVYPEFWSAKGNGTADDASALLAAGDSLGGRCGTVQLSPGKRYRVGTSLRLPRCVTFRGTTPLPDDPSGHQTSNYSSVGAILLDSTATISLNSSAGIENTIILQNGLPLPAPDTGAYAGTAISCAPGTPGAGDAATRANGPFLRNVLIIGFNRSIYCVNSDRARFEQVEYDTVNGVFSEGSFDTQHFNRIRGWQFGRVGFAGWNVTGASGNGTTATLTFTPASTMRVGTSLTVTGLGAYNTTGTVMVTASSPGSVSYASTATGSASGGKVANPSHTFRSPGTGFEIAGQQDDTHVTNSLMIGYDHAFTFGANGNVMGDMLWADNFPFPAAGSTGFLFKNTQGRSSMGQLYANGSAYALKFDETGGIYGGINIKHLFAFTNAPGGECINVGPGATGFLTIDSLEIVGCPSWAIDVQSPNAKVRIDGGTIAGAQGGQTSQPYIAVPAGSNTSNIQIAEKKLLTDQVLGAALIGGNQLPDMAIASAASIALPASGADAYALTGTATVTTITGGTHGGREALFTCSAACNFGAGGNLALVGGAVLNGSTGTQIKFRYDANQGMVWREQWRSKP